MRHKGLFAVTVVAALWMVGGCGDDDSGATDAGVDATTQDAGSLQRPLCLEPGLLLTRTTGTNCAHSGWGWGWFLLSTYGSAGTLELCSATLCDRWWETLNGR